MLFWGVGLCFSTQKEKTRHSRVIQISTKYTCVNYHAHKIHIYQGDEEYAPSTVLGTTAVQSFFQAISEKSPCWCLYNCTRRIVSQAPRGGGKVSFIFFVKEIFLIEHVKISCKYLYPSFNYFIFKKDH